MENIEKVRDCGWTFVTRFQGNRKVRIGHGAAVALAEQPIAAAGPFRQGTRAWLPACGEARVFRAVAPNGDTTHWAANDLGLDEPGGLTFGEPSWSIEERHRGLKQFAGVERCHVRAARGQRHRNGCAIRAFVRLERHRFTTGESWLAAKWAVIRDAVRADLEHPRYRLPGMATA